jgi:large subunit ribosomal protein L25
MKTVSLSGSPRENVGKKDARKHRKNGEIPCVIYGGKEQLHFVIQEKDFKKIFHVPEVYLLNLSLSGNEYTAIVQDVQYHPVTDHVLHADFLEVLPDKPVVIAVPVKPEGVPVGVLKGGKFHTKLRKVKVRALAKDLPDNLVVKTDDLDIGDSIKVMDLKQENVTFLDPPSTVLVAVRTARAVVEEVPAAAAGEGEAAAAGAEGGKETGKEGKEGKDKEKGEEKK